MFDFPLSLTIGALYVSLLDKYGDTRSNTAMVQSIFMGCTTITSVLSGVLVKRFGPARVSFLGSTLLSSGFVFSYFATSILVLNMLIGVVAGFGNCLLFVSSTVVVGSIFEGTTKEIALSIHNVVIGLGSIIYTYILNSLSNLYGVNGTFLILGTVVLNSVVVSLLTFFNETRNCSKLNGKHHKDKFNKRDLSCPKDSFDITENPSRVDPIYLKEKLDKSGRESNEALNKKVKNIHRNKTLETICTQHQESRPIPTADTFSHLQATIDHLLYFENLPSIDESIDKTEYASSIQDNLNTNGNSSRFKEAVSKADISCPATETKSRSTLKNRVVQNGNQSDIKTINGDNFTRVNSTEIIGKGFLKSNIRARVSQLINVRYIFVLIGAACAGATLQSYLVVFGDIFVSKGCSSDGIQNQFLVFNTASMISRAFPIIFSKIKPGSDFVELLTVGSLIGCIGQLFILLFTEVGLLYVGNFLSGLALGSVLSGATVSIANITPKDVFGVAFGLLMSVLGIVSAAGGPLYGYIRDETSSYSSAIVVTAAANAFAALLFTASKFADYCKTKMKAIRVSQLNSESNESTTVHYGSTNNT